MEVGDLFWLLPMRAFVFHLSSFFWFYSCVALFHLSWIFLPPSSRIWSLSQSRRISVLACSLVSFLAPRISCNLSSNERPFFLACNWCMRVRMSFRCDADVCSEACVLISAGWVVGRVFWAYFQRMEELMAVILGARLEAKKLSIYSFVKPCLWVSSAAVLLISSLSLFGRALDFSLAAFFAFSSAFSFPLWPSYPGVHPIMIPLTVSHEVLELFLGSVD